MWPKSFWEKVYEPMIRRAAGLGSASNASRSRQIREILRALRPSGDRLRTDRPHGGADGGAFGETRSFSRTRGRGSAVSLLFEREEIDGKPGLDWANGVIAELASMPNVTLMPRTTIFGWYDGNVFGASSGSTITSRRPPPYEPRQRYWRIIAKRAVLAAGAEERPIAFGGNDVPGVMLASAMRTYANRYATAAGGSAVVFTNNDSGYRTARDLKAHGVARRSDRR